MISLVGSEMCIRDSLRLAQPSKDDSALDKKAGAGIVKPTAALARPAARPLSAKSISAQNVPVSLTSTNNVTSKGLSLISEGIADQPKKLVAKKSTRVLKTADTVSQSEAEIKKPVSILPSQSSLVSEPQGGVPLPARRFARQRLFRCVRRLRPGLLPVVSRRASRRPMST